MVRLTWAILILIWSYEKTQDKNTSGKTFIKYRRQLDRDYNNVTIVVNNPCLEFWLLLHFEKTSRHFSNCAKAETQLKKHLADYEKTRRYYTRQDNDIYLKLKPYLHTALKNASALGLFDEDNPYKAMCEMELFYLSEELENILNRTIIWAK